LNRPRPAADALAFTGIDSMQKRVYGYRMRGTRFGHTKIQGKSLLVKGLNALAATVSTPLAALRDRITSRISRMPKSRNDRFPGTSHQTALCRNTDRDNISSIKSAKG
jgi:hypothetical protein